MPAYLIYDVEIHDPEPYAEFMTRVKPLVEKMGGTYLARGGAHEVLEGDWNPTRIVLFQFPDMDSARALFNSDDYAPLKELRHSCSTGHVVIVEGV
ncbi:DUF1330 domain-containing protein [Shimia thalassica]|uniref:DUF1330 domain-containing protein n=1 Tax=Shimia thalassica TaxID=1715693 RepID=UPI001C086E40|nr:DUF1330 domain-containing protein [Shimia thalassica]MBU2942216.1 DUF1330 domain-containing protein [Shimia thalassica]MDO6502814.1 DUF1330 domain-containing protein [Shimia thalassica]MDO6522583.1 DUF1330 domain-containing protein [Shimia thalassica]MDO6798033.1 DUF1330 domain-containing protein [Shimia thalassica]MDP2493723.1 DUF1330 domain-containing protein [Shimia thalassica]